MKFLLQIFSLALSILRGSAEGNGTVRLTTNDGNEFSEDAIYHRSLV